MHRYSTYLESRPKPSNQRTRRNPSFCHHTKCWLPRTQCVYRASEKQTSSEPLTMMETHEKWATCLRLVQCNKSTRQSLSKPETMLTIHNSQINHHDREVWLRSVNLHVVSRTIYSLFRVLFNFPSRYLLAIGLTQVFSLWWSLPPTLDCILKQSDSKAKASKNSGAWSNFYGAITRFSRHIQECTWS